MLEIEGNFSKNPEAQKATLRAFLLFVGATKPYREQTPESSSTARGWRVAVNH
ncbi:MAG: hypothetical protein ACP5FH_06170 [Terracidiphilus sp.]